MKHFVSLLLILTLLAALSACGQKSAAPEATAPAPETASAPETAPAETAPAETEAVTESVETGPAETGAAEAPAEASFTGFPFETTDHTGAPVNQQLFDGYRVIMINLWEPWCGPCVGEMPELEKLYQSCKDQGLLIVGVYSTPDNVEQILAQTGVSYPVIAYTGAFAPFTSMYVPTTVFLGPDGTLLTEQVIGSRSYDEWAAIAADLL